MFSEGKFRTVLYAKKNIKKGEELFFDYDHDGTISTNFPGKYPFIKGGPKKWYIRKLLILNIKNKYFK